MLLTSNFGTIFKNKLDEILPLLKSKKKISFKRINQKLYLN